MKKIGLWIPSRKNYTPISLEKPGYFMESFTKEIIREIEKGKKFKVFNHVDFRNAWCENGKVFLNDFCLSDLDLFLWMGEINRETGSYHLEVLDTLADSTIVVNNPRAVKIGLDKYLSQKTLLKNGITVPDFLLVKSNNLESVEKKIREKKFILKPRLGSFGTGIVEIKDFDQLVDIVDYSDNSTHFLEEFIDFDFKDWIGVNVIGGEIAYGYGKHKSKINGFKVFDRKRIGGKMHLKKPSKEQEKIALKIGKVTGLDFFGIDIIADKNGKNYVIDVNTFPGLYPELMKEAKINGAKMIAKMIYKKLK